MLYLWEVVEKQSRVCDKRSSEYADGELGSDSPPFDPNRAQNQTHGVGLAAIPLQRYGLIVLSLSLSLSLSVSLCRVDAH